MVFGVFKHVGPRSVVAEDEVPMGSERSVLRDFITSVATMTGDLSNITAPSSILAPKSTVQVPSYQGENPSLFCSGADSADPAERAMLVLRSFLGGIRSQCYMSQKPGISLKKPLNAFLGEIFLAKWEDGNGTTSYIGEQVSHHPPITACRITNETHGVTFQAHNQSSITFSTSVNVLSSGYAMKSFTRFSEHYLIPIPDFKVRGLLSTPYPELSGTYSIPSTSGYISVVHFSEPGFFGSSSKQHSFEAYVFKQPSLASSQSDNQPLYTLKGQWHTHFSIHKSTDDTLVETFSVQSHADSAPSMQVASLDIQDPWESQSAWREVIAGITSSDMRATSQAKSKLEQNQRQMRKDDKTRNEQWKSLFFNPVDLSTDQGQGEIEIVESLAAMSHKDDLRRGKIDVENGWTFDEEGYKKAMKRGRGNFHERKPDGTLISSDKYENEDEKQDLKQEADKKS